jgi:hypothetical protein
MNVVAIFAVVKCLCPRKECTGYEKRWPYSPFIEQEKPIITKDASRHATGTADAEKVQPKS